VTVFHDDGVRAELLKMLDEVPVLPEMPLRHLPVETVKIDTLQVSLSPRLAGVSDEHVRLLAETGDPLPPIIVHRPTLSVIDGAHRVRAAVLRGQTHIEARFFDGAEDDAFVLAVHVNGTHGLPLSLADRKAAALRIINSYPQWSDRAIARTTGLSDKTVGAVRRHPDAGPAYADTRMGRDGRLRPLDAKEGRRLAAELIRENPGISLRGVARHSGISPETARKVRDEVLRETHTEHPPSRGGAGGVRGDQRRGDGSAEVPTAQVIARKLRILQRDPVLRFNETGRVLLRLLTFHQLISERRDGLVRSVPGHSLGTVTEVALACARAWQELAAELERREAAMK
jgi:ParB-like chromosome segregation protein Spo0J